MPRPRFVRCCHDPACPTLDTQSGEVVSAREDAPLLDATAAEVRAALGLGGEAYMQRAIACAALDRSALAALFPRLESERQCPACTTSAQGLVLASYGQVIDPAVAEVLIACRAPARAVQAAGAKMYRGRPDLQIRAARAAMAGAPRRGSPVIVGG